ncbi:DNA-3-methyladenine glycosylase I [Leptolyngbya cf. ectocarpi LEGE 11479]|uniref:DNA-3-methyladenine glycosylase I n=1 Tax=Leptolyngbya cf. ectocarpi LEGE 11479 TaxID=1828722 RepID=A0A928ZQF9_LEPEC|nr:DNA-3-methyladenine glycosylase I [Leptolyngbya ectocarpi]MBE9065338.1 DNA-3-methyladenine glycosylase I [Leptolyngbya cf. ectocarpi LEGE 11479]
MTDGLIAGADGQVRCWWPGEDAEYLVYHDHEWGHPVADDIQLFEKICLEGFQAGLSWLTILRKRDNFRAAFEHFQFEAVARYTETDVERLLQNAGIVRHRRKIESTINNAQRACDLVDEYGSLASYFWQYEPAARPERCDYATLSQLSKTAESTALSKDLKKRGWSFVGPTTAYAFMQAMGLVNDHLEGCFACRSVEKKRSLFERP